MDIGKAISKAFDLFTKNIVVLIVAMLVAQIVGGFTFLILMGPLMAGMVYICLKLIRGETAEIGDVFKRFDKFGPAFVLFLLLGAAVFGIWIVTIILALIPILGPLVALLLWLALAVASPLVGAAVVFALCSMVEKNLAVGPAIKEAVERIKAKPVEIWLVALVFCLISSICAFITAPIGLVGLVLLYLEGAEISVQPSVPA